MAPNRQPNYTVQQCQELQHQNKFVQVYLASPLALLFIILVGSNYFSIYLSYRRRRHATKFVLQMRPSASCSRTGRRCTMWLPGTVLSLHRKLVYRSSGFAETLGMSSLGEFGAILSWYALNFVLVGINCE